MTVLPSGTAAGRTRFCAHKRFPGRENLGEAEFTSAEQK